MALPKTVVKKDRDLMSDYESVGMEIMELRWHWTLDASNPKRVSIREYAHEVGRGISIIRADANGWRDKLADDAKAAEGGYDIVTAKTAGDYREMAKLSEVKRTAAEAMAKARGTSVSNIAANKREDLTAVVNRARERAERKGRADTEAVLEEIEAVVEWDAKAAATQERLDAEHRANHTSRWLNIEADLAVAMQRLRKVLNTAEGVGFTDDEREFITEALGKCRALMNLIDLRIAGEAPDIDWDAELQKIAN
jgi:hypothetical protein